MTRGLRGLGVEGGKGQERVLFKSGLIHSDKLCKQNKHTANILNANFPLALINILKYL